MPKQSPWGQVYMPGGKDPDPQVEINKLKQAAGISPFVGPPTEADMAKQLEAEDLKRAYVKWLFSQGGN